MFSTRIEAYKNGDRTFYTGVPCKNGHIDLRYVSNGGCVKCLNRYSKSPPIAPGPTMFPMEINVFVGDPVPPTVVRELKKCLQDWTCHFLEHRGIKSYRERMKELTGK